MEIQGGELFQLDFADVGRDVVFNVAAVIFSGAVLDNQNFGTQRFEKLT